LSNAIRPSATTTRTFLNNPNSRTRNVRHARISSVAGLLSGGAHRADAVIHASRNSSPSSRQWLSACVANPVLCSTPYRKSPDLSPVNIRPVRFAPCAPGARPTINTRAAGSPNGGTGFPQYC